MSRTSAARRLVAVLAAAVLALVSLVSSPIAAHAADLPPSVSFDNWSTYRSGDAQTAFTSAPGHTGNGLRLISQSTMAPNVYAMIFQAVTVEPSTTYELSAWVRADGLPDAGLVATADPDWVERYGFPAGSYDWQQVTWTYTTAADETSVTLRFISQDAYASVDLDELTMKAAGTEENLLQNGDFAASSGQLSITNESLLFDPGTAELALHTEAPGVTTLAWAIADERGQPITDGSAPVTDAKATIDASALPQGFYTLKVTATPSATPIVLTTSFGVVEPVTSAALDPSSPYGIGIHDFTAQTIRAMARIGMKHARTDVDWSGAETTKGQYDFPAGVTDGFENLTAAGIEPLPISDYRNPFYDDNLTPSTPAGLAGYGNYTAAVNSHFADQTKAVEIYNEFNHVFNDGKCGRTPDCYAQLLLAAASAVDAQNNNAGNDDATIVGPGIAGASEDYVRQVLEAGGKNVLDAVSVHPYRHPTPPEGIEAQTASLVKVIKDTAGRDIPLWYSELGWPTNTPVNGVTDWMQADFLARSTVLSIAGGADRVYWYDARDDGDDPENQEHNFGLFERADVAATAAEPKPAGVAHAVLAHQVGTKKAGDRDDLGESGVYSYPFGSGADTTRVLWAPEAARTVRLSTSQPLKLISEYGREHTLASVDGAVTVTLTNHPLYVTGSVTDVALVEQPAVSLSVAPTVAKGESVEVTAVLDRTGERCDGTPASVTFDVEGVEQTLATNECTKVEKAFEVPTGPDQTTTWFTGTVSADGSTFAHVATPTVRITSAVTVTATLALDGDDQGDFDQPVTLTVANNSRTQTIGLDGITWTAGGKEGTIEDDTALAAGESVQHVVTLDDLDLWRPEYFDATVKIVDGDPVTLHQSVGIGPILPDADAAEQESIELASDATWIPLENATTSPEDLGGSVKITRVANGLRLRASITDDAFAQRNGADALWNGDSVQLSFSPGQPGTTGLRTEIGVGLTPSGPAAYTFAGSGTAITGLTTTENLSVTRSGTTTSYDVVLPWESLGVPVAPTGVFALALVVNDDDGAGRKGYLEWASGIGKTKNTAQHFPVELVTAAPAVDTTPPVISGVPEGIVDGSKPLQLAVKATDAESAVTSLAVTVDGKPVAPDASLELAGGEHRIVVTATNGAGLVAKAEGSFVVVPGSGATTAPAKGALKVEAKWPGSPGHGFYDVVLRSSGEPATLIRLSENGKLVQTVVVKATKPGQVTRFRFADRANGTYRYTATAYNTAGKTDSSAASVTVTKAAPAKPRLKALVVGRKVGLLGYTLGGTNATSYAFTIDGTEVASGSLKARTPLPQRAAAVVKNVARGRHQVRVVFTNGNGSTVSDVVAIRVR